MLGLPVTKELIKADFEVTLLVRDVDKAKTIFGTKAHLITGDLRNISSIKQLLNGQDALYLNLSVAQTSVEHDFQPERDGLNNILVAAKNSSLKRIGYLSSLLHLYQGQNGFNWWAFEIKKEAVTKIKNSGLAYSVFYPSTFMESFDKGAYRQGSSIVLAGTSKQKMFLISASDYGKQVAKAFQLDIGACEYTVQGQDGYTADEAAKLYTDNYKKSKIKIIKAPLWVLQFIGNFVNKFHFAAKIIDALNNHPEIFKADKTWQRLGKPQTKFIDYIKNS